MQQPEPMLSCHKCGNDQAFDTIKTYYHKVVLDSSAQIESSRVYEDKEGEELEITCRKCGATLSMQNPISFADEVEKHLQYIDDGRHTLMDTINESKEISLEIADDIGTAACAITDALGEIRHELERHELHQAQPTVPTARPRRAD